MTDADLVIYSTLIIVALVVAMLSGWAIRQSRRAERESEALTVEQLRAASASRLLPGPYIWGIWQGVNSMHSKRLILRDGTGALVAEINYLAIQTEGVIRYFDFEGKRYEYGSEGLISGRMWLRESASGAIVLSCHHGVRYRTIFRAATENEIVRIHNPGLISEIGDVTQNGRKLGQLFYERQCHARVLSLQRPSLTVLEQCFVMLSAG